MPRPIVVDMGGQMKLLYCPNLSKEFIKGILKYRPLYKVRNQVKEKLMDKMVICNNIIIPSKKYIIGGFYSPINKRIYFNLSFNGYLLAGCEIVKNTNNLKNTSRLVTHELIHSIAIEKADEMLDIFENVCYKYYQTFWSHIIYDNQEYIDIVTKIHYNINMNYLFSTRNLITFFGRLGYMYNNIKNLFLINKLKSLALALKENKEIKVNTKILDFLIENDFFVKLTSKNFGSVNKDIRNILDDCYKIIYKDYNSSIFTGQELYSITEILSYSANVDTSTAEKISIEVINRL